MTTQGESMTPFQLVETTVLLVREQPKITVYVHPATYGSVFDALTTRGVAHAVQLVQDSEMPEGQCRFDTGELGSVTLPDLRQHAARQALRTRVNILRMMQSRLAGAAGERDDALREASEAGVDVRDLADDSGLSVNEVGRILAEQPAAR